MSRERASIAARDERGAERAVREAHEAGAAMSRERASIAARDERGAERAVREAHEAGQR